MSSVSNNLNSPMVSWVSATEQGSMEQTMISQVSVLYEQMISLPTSEQERAAQPESASVRQIMRMQYGR